MNAGIALSQNAAVRYTSPPVNMVNVGAFNVGLGPNCESGEGGVPMWGRRCPHTRHGKR